MDVQLPKTEYRESFRQRTLQNWVSAQGVGLHTGRVVELSMGPGPQNSGVVFERLDLPGCPRVVARPKSIVHSEYRTVLHSNGAKVSTVEHLLAAIAGLGVDNVRIVLDGEEIPILDGSAYPFVQLIQQAGIRTQEAFRTCLRIIRPLKFSQGDRSIQLFPSKRLSVDCTVGFNHPLVSYQRRRYQHSADGFEREISAARTFGFLKDVGQMKRAGLAKGGSLTNAVVIDSFSILNPGGLRFSDEFVRHKVLDILGDLALFGGPLVARVVAVKSGHRLHHALIRHLAQHTEDYIEVQYSSDRQEQSLCDDQTSFSLPDLQRA